MADLDSTAQPTVNVDPSVSHWEGRGNDLQG